MDVSKAVVLLLGSLPLPWQIKVGAKVRPLLFLFFCARPPSGGREKCFEWKHLLSFFSLAVLPPSEEEGGESGR